jgi:hypothetical protein
MVPMTFAVWAGYLFHSTASFMMMMTMAVRIPMFKTKLRIEKKSNIVIIFNPPREFAICAELVQYEADLHLVESSLPHDLTSRQLVETFDPFPHLLWDVTY